MNEFYFNILFNIIVNFICLGIYIIGYKKYFRLEKIEKLSDDIYEITIRFIFIKRTKRVFRSGNQFYNLNNINYVGDKMNGLLFLVIQNNVKELLNKPLEYKNIRQHEKKSLFILKDIGIY